MNRYFRVGAVICMLGLACLLLYAMKEFAIKVLRDAGFIGYDDWVGYAGLLLLMLVGRFFMGLVILECARGWPQLFRGDRSKWPFR